jgi:hypothetical protein
MQQDNLIDNKKDDLFSQRDYEIYASALFDGEGTITINHQRYIKKSGSQTDYYYPLINIYNDCGKTLQEMQKKLQLGSIYKLSSKDHYIWSIYGSDALTFIERMIPFSRIKKDQLLAAKNYSKDLSTEEKKELYLLLKKLKKKRSTD